MVQATHGVIRHRKIDNLLSTEKAYETACIGVLHRDICAYAIYWRYVVRENDSMIGTRIDVDGQHGFVEIDDHMIRNPNEKIARAARVSFGNEDSEREYDGLINYLAIERETSPFRHSPMTLVVQCPEFVARQWYKHVVGGPYAYVDAPWNEISGRYVTYDKFYIPPDLFEQSKRNKQGSTDTVHADSAYYRGWMIGTVESLKTMYDRMVAAGVAKEQARMILPLNLYTRFHWTPSELALYHFCELRTKPNAQREIRAYATAVNELCLAYYGESWQALKDNFRKKYD